MSLTKCKCVLCDCPKGTEQSVCPDCAYHNHSKIESDHSKRLKRVMGITVQQEGNDK